MLTQVSVQGKYLDKLNTKKIVTFFQQQQFYIEIGYLSLLLTVTPFLEMPSTAWWTGGQAREGRETTGRAPLYAVF